MGDGAQKIRTHLFHFGLCQPLFPLCDHLGLDGHMGGHGTQDQSDPAHQQEGDRVAGQCEIKLIIRIGEQIIDRYYGKKGADNAVAVAHRPSGDDHQCQNVEQCYIGMVVRYYMLI